MLSIGGYTTSVDPVICSESTTTSKSGSGCRRRATSRRSLLSSTSSPRRSLLTCTTTTHYTVTISTLQSVTITPALTCPSASVCNVSGLSIDACGKTYVETTTYTETNHAISCATYSGTNFVVSPPSITARLASDPYAVCGVNTGCDYKFGLTAAQLRTIAISCLVVGCIWTAAVAVGCFFGCKQITKQHGSVNQWRQNNYGFAVQQQPPQQQMMMQQQPVYVQQQPVYVQQQPVYGQPVYGQPVQQQQYAPMMQPGQQPMQYAQPVYVQQGQQQGQQQTYDPKLV